MKLSWVLVLSPLLSLKSLFDKICFILHSLYGAVGQNTFFLLLHYFYHIVLFYLDIIIIYVMKLAVKYTYMQVSSLVSLFISLQHWFIISHGFIMSWLNIFYLFDPLMTLSCDTWFTICMKYCYINTSVMVIHDFGYNTL